MMVMFCRNSGFLFPGMHQEPVKKILNPCPGKPTGDKEQRKKKRRVFVPDKTGGKKRNKAAQDAKTYSVNIPGGRSFVDRFKFSSHWLGFKFYV